MDISFSKSTGLHVARTKSHRAFILMIFGWTISYTHFLEHYIGIAWTRSLEIGERRWWFTEGWQVWAKKDKNKLSFVLGRDD